MENHIIMDDKAKRNMGILSLLPVFAWAVVLFYYLFALAPLISAKMTEAHEEVVTVTYNHYDMLFMLSAIAAVISAIVLIYFIVHIARIKTMNGPTKAIWILAMSALVPIGFPIFWYMEIRNERREMPVHHNIA